MSRWTGDPEVGPVLEAGDAWRERCFLGSTSILTDGALWTLLNLNDLLTRYADHPIAGKRDFLDKFEEQLSGAPAATIRLAAEVLWLLHLFPSGRTLSGHTKREQISKVWSWSGEAAPDSPFLDDAHLRGVGHPGTAYFTHRPSEYEYLIRVFVAFKSLPAAEQGRLLQEDVPWTFMTWLDGQPGSDRRLTRGAILYFLFPDHLERNLSKDHKRQIYASLKSKLAADDVIKSRTPNIGSGAEFRRPPLAWVPVRIVLSQPADAVPGFGAPGGRAGGIEAILRAAEIVGFVPQRGDELRIDGRVCSVEAARPDSLGITWRLVLSEA